MSFRALKFSKVESFRALKFYHPKTLKTHDGIYIICLGECIFAYSIVIINIFIRATYYITGLIQLNFGFLQLNIIVKTQDSGPNQTQSTLS